MKASELRVGNYITTVRSPAPYRVKGVNTYGDMWGARRPVQITRDEWQRNHPKTEAVPVYFQKERKPCRLRRRACEELDYCEECD